MELHFSKLMAPLNSLHIRRECKRRSRELRVTVDDEGPGGKRMKDVMLSKGKPLILEKVRVWVQSIARGSPIKDELENKKLTPSPSPSPVSLSPSTSTIAAPKNETSTSTKKKEKKGVKSISMTEVQF